MGEALGYKAEAHHGYWRMQCCGHNGAGFNLDVRDGQKGVLLKCESEGCSLDKICQGVGISAAALFFEPRAGPNGPRGQERIFPYRDEKGGVLYEIRRFEATATSEKKFEAWLPDAERAGIRGTRRVLFGLPELLATLPGDVVGIAEGEKCALAVAALGVVCTTNPFGATQWKADYTAWLVANLPDRRFLVLADNDRKGKEHALGVCEALAAAGLKVWLADLGLLPEAGDVVQWIKRGGAAEQLRAQAADPAPKLWARILNFEQLLAQPSPDWLIDGLFMEESMVEFYGPPNEGKTFVAVDGCMALRRGGSWCGRSIDRTGPVLYISADGGLGFADRARAYVLIAGRLEGEEEFWTLPEPVNLYRADAVQALAEVLAYMPRKPIVLVVDTYSRCMAGVNENQQEFASLVVDNLTSLMREFHFATWLLHHADKTGQHDRGSSVVLGACDTQLRITMSKEKVVTMSCEKQRDAPRFDPIYFDLGRVPGTNETWVTWRTEAPTPAGQAIEAAIEAVVGRHPGMTRKAAYLALDLSQTTLRNHLKRLILAGRIVERETERQPGRKGPPEFGLYPGEKQTDWGLQ